MDVLGITETHWCEKHLSWEKEAKGRFLCGAKPADGDKAAGVGFVLSMDICAYSSRMRTRDTRAGYLTPLIINYRYRMARTKRARENTPACGQTEEGREEISLDLNF